MTLSKSKTSSLAASLSTSSANSASSSHNGATSTLSTHNGQKSASNYQECADCSSPSAFWASLNHGVVVCDQCCLAHRSLGRAISIIKSLKKSYWPQSQIDTLYELVRNNSNSIWEANLNNSAELMKHSLLKNLKKPTPKDSYTNKANYVKIKYENLALISRGKYTSIDELNQQLLASVRTSDLKSTLRILSQGADANYRNPEDGNQCIHAATVAGELGQIELLCLYGADVAALDRNGLIPSEIARMHHPTQPHIADRLVELQFELTDELSYFLASKRPDHRNARHFLIPDIENFSNMKDAMSRLKLDELPDHLFEELAKDIYDEMDRRQIESIWKCTVSQNLVNEPIPFLVIKSCFTQMRNQLRQKLARFNSHEFSCLLLEILNESQRRYNQIENPISPKGGLSLDDDEEEEDPLYDKVPSDEDYASVASESSSTIQVPISSSSNTPSKTLKSTTTTSTTPKKSLYQTVSPLNILTSASAAAGKLTGSASPTKTLKATGSPSAATTTSSSSKSSSNKNTPSPKSSSLFPTSGASSSHKILNTKFEKIPTASTAALAAATSALSTSGLPSGVLQLNSGPANSSALVANAESCLNSIINSLNQIDYSHLTATHAAAAAAVSHGSNHRNYCGGLTNNESPSNATDFVVQPASIGEIRPNLYNELKSENELMQAMIERLMDENAQLRAEKMLLTANSNTTSSTASTINSDTNITHYAMYVENRPSSRSVTEELSLYSTVKNPTKKSSKPDFNQQQHANIFDEHSNYKKFYDDSNNLEIIEEGLYQYDESTNQEQESEKLKSNVVSSKEKLFPTSKSVSGQYYNSGSNNGAETMSQLPSKDSVIRAMKKITKTVQDLFKATKLSEFSNLKASCDKVNNSVHEMISLFPLNLNSAEIEENLITLEETCKNLTDLMGEYSAKIDLFVSNGGRENDSENTIDSSSSSSKQQQISTSSSSSSAISSSNSEQFKHQQQQQQQLSADDIAIKNMIITNLVSYSYEIAHTVKRIVCAMGAD